MLLNDRQLFDLIRAGNIRNTEQSVRGDGKISFGVSSYGYDIRLAPRLLLCRASISTVNGKLGTASPVDPKGGNKWAFLDELPIEESSALAEHPGRYVTLPPHSFALGMSMEEFTIPDNVLVVCVGKSTYARCGIIVNVTPLEPGWKGTITLELSNTTPCPARVYVEEGISQLLFHAQEERPQRTYADKNGKYQGQTEITLPRL